MISNSRSVVLIGGPTASGKSALALALAEEIQRRRGVSCVIVNADALQLYQDLCVLSARPGDEDEARVAHRLYGVLDGAERGSVARWMEMARREVATVLATGKVPLVVGGTGLYLRALMQGLAVVPEIDPEVRAWVLARHAELGGEAFREELRALDPDGALMLAAGDTQRLVRAYEVVKGTGRTLHYWQAQKADLPPEDWRFMPFVVAPPRAVLYQNCDLRFDLMMEQGAIEEVRMLVARGLSPDLPVMKAVGVPELAAYLRGELEMEEVRRKAQQATRRYAKRQLTWFRNQMKEAEMIALDGSRPGDVMVREQVDRVIDLAGI